MRPAEVEIRFYDTYYFANVVKNVLGDQFSYIRHLNDFYGDGRQFFFAKPFPRFSALHAFLEFIIDDLVCETSEIDIDHLRNSAKSQSTSFLAQEAQGLLLPLNRAFQHYEITHTSFEEFLRDTEVALDEADSDDVYNYYLELRLQGAVENLVSRAVDEVFYILFSNRQLLLNFNEMMTRQIACTELDEVPEEQLPYFVRSGVLRRVSIPQWVKDAVFFRDRGRCVFCRSDLSGLITIGSDKNFDHVVPLAQGGLNDVTNVQLLCDGCNSRKSAGEAITSDFYQAWYDLQAK
jgi:hypothetical protein